MGTSHPETKPWVLNKLTGLNLTPVDRILDVGAGAGNWLSAIRGAQIPARVDAVEVWQPYIEEFRLRRRYARVFDVDVRTLEPRFFNRYRAVIFGDVLEHMTKEEAQLVWDLSSRCHRFIAIPIVHYCQGPLNGNPYEEHIKDDWSPQEVLDSFPGILDWALYTVTGAFWAPPATAPSGPATLRDATAAV